MLNCLNYPGGVFIQRTDRDLVMFVCMNTCLMCVSLSLHCPTCRQLCYVCILMGLIAFWTCEINLSYLCFFDLILYVAVNIISVMSGRVSLGWTSVKPRDPVWDILSLCPVINASSTEKIIWGIGFLSITCPDPLENHKAAMSAFHVGPSSASQRNAGGPMIARF